MRSPRLAGVVIAGVLVLAGCGDGASDDADTARSTSAPSTATPSTLADTGTTVADPAGGSGEPAPEKPAVSIPAAIPAELVITDITVGTGPEAKPGDVLQMRYVGVRSEDGTEFDSNYDSPDTLDLTLGSGRVIQGWEEGLIGIREGGRRQLDIPAELAYGDNPQPGSPIQPGDALTFVVDAVGVIATPDPADRPELTVEGGANVAQLQVEDLVVGTGDELGPAQTAVAYLTAYRGDTGEELLSSWDSGVLEQLDLAQTIPGLAEGMVGMREGGRRQIRIPFEQAFGADGNPDLGAGLPASTDLIMVIELFGIL